MVTRLTRSITVRMFVASAVLMLAAVAFWPLPPALGQAGQGRLVQSADLVYEGAFRVPDGDTNDTTFEYGGTALAYWPAHKSLLLVGHDWRQRVAELGIPRLAKGVPVAQMATAPLMQPLSDPLKGRLGRIGEGTAKIGGLLVWGDALIASAYLYYDGNGSQRLSHFRAGLELAGPAQPTGPFQVGGVTAGFVSGYMAPVPLEWQAQLGGPALTGQCCLSIISRTSFGPSVSVFDPVEVGGKSPAKATRVLGYPGDHATLGQCEGQSKLFNCTTMMAGVVFPPGTRSVLFFGRQGIGPYCYGEGGAGGHCEDPASSAKGTHAYPYVYQVWAYDVLDLVQVRNGRKKPWDIKPYATWNFELPFAPPSRSLGGVAYDPATRRLYVSAAESDGAKPLVHVFRLRE